MVDDDGEFTCDVGSLTCLAAMLVVVYSVVVSSSRGMVDGDVANVDNWVLR